MITGWRSYAITAGVGVLLSLAALVGLQMYGKAQYRRGYVQAQTEYRLLAVDAEKHKRRVEQVAQQEIENVRNEYQALFDRNALAAAAADAESVSLRDKLAAANRRAEREAARTGSALDENARLAAELRDVVAMCSTRYQQLGKVTDGLRGDLMGLQGWARALKR